MHRISLLALGALLLTTLTQSGYSQSVEPTERIVVKVGQTRTAGFMRQPGRVDPPSSSNASIATARFTSDDTVVISGIAIGRALITVRGTIARYQAGANVPLREDRPFQVVIQVDVVAATTSATDEFYQDAKSLLEFTVRSLEGTKVRWTADYLNKIPADVNGRISDHLRATRDAAARLTRNYEWLKKGTVRQDEFFRVGFDLVRLGLKTSWQADLDDAGFSVALINKTYQKTESDLSSRWYKTMASAPEEKQRAERPGYMNQELDALKKALKDYAETAQVAAARHRSQISEATWWNNRASGLTLPGQVRFMEAFLHEQFTYDITRALTTAERSRIFPGSAPDYSTLDLFVHASGSADRLTTSTTFIEKAQVTAAGAPYRSVVQFNWDTSPGLFKMDPAFRSQKVSASGTAATAPAAKPGKVRIDPDKAPPSPAGGSPAPGGPPVPGESPAPPKEEPGLPLPPVRAPMPRTSTPPTPPAVSKASTAVCSSPWGPDEKGASLDVPVSFLQITLRPASRQPDVLTNTPIGLVSTEPYFVDLWVDREQAATLGGTVDVAFRVPYSGRTGSLRVSSARAAARGLVLYTTDKPFTFAKGGEGGGKVTVLGFEFSTGDMSALRVDEGETVVVSFRGATTEAPVYPSIERMQIAMARESYRTYRALYDGMLQDPALRRDAALQRYLRDQLRMLLNADILTSHDYDPAFPDYTTHIRLRVAEQYQKMLGSDPRQIDGIMPPSHEGGSYSAPGVQFLSGNEAQILTGAKAEADALLAKRALKSAITATITMADIVIQESGIDKWSMAITGRDIWGNEVSVSKQLGAAAKIVVGYSFGRIIKDTIAAKLDTGSNAAPGGPRSGLRPSATRTRPVIQAGGKGADVRHPKLQRSAVTPNQAVLPGATQVVNGPGGWTKAPMPNSGAMFGEHLQRGETTCGLMVARSCIKEAKGVAASETVLVNTAAMKGLYKPAVGMTRLELASFMRMHGANVGIASADVTIPSIARELFKGRQVATMVKTGSNAHWVRVYDVAACEGAGRVRFGDPWNGQVWEVDAKIFAAHMYRHAGGGPHVDTLSIDWLK
jgi:hypothetical protein